MIDKIALILAIIGGLNWGLVGIFQLDAVAWVLSLIHISRLRSP